MVAKALNQSPVLNVIGQYREIDEGEAGRISFLLGGIVRSLANKGIDAEGIARAVAFTANMIKLSKGGSGEAIAAAIAMYIFSDGPITKDLIFKGHIYHMGEAITEDPISPWETADLGISQAARLLGFVRKMQNGQGQEKAIIAAMRTYQEALTADLPTIGAEFHIPYADDMNGTFWQRAAILNMSQYQSGSHIPFSRMEEGLIEIRMNPSIYPVSTATWNLMRLLLPELNSSYFTITINRRDRDFSKGEENMIMFLHALGNLSYAAFFRGVPSVTTPQQVNFGDRYLGQTVRVTNGDFILTGNWGSKRGQEGQLNICSGFGDLFPQMAFYLSMGLVEPVLLKSHGLGDKIRKAESLSNALKFKEEDIRNIFETLNRLIVGNRRMSSTVKHGQRIIEELRP